MPKMRENSEFLKVVFGNIPKDPSQKCMTKKDSELW